MFVCLSGWEGRFLLLRFTRHFYIRADPSRVELWLDSGMLSLVQRHHVELWSWPKKPQKSPTKHKTWNSNTIFHSCWLPPSDCCSPTCYLSPSTKCVNSPSPPPLPYLIFLWHPMEEADSAGPSKPSEESTATVKTTCAASCQLHTRLYTSSTPRHSWSELPQCPLSPEGGNFFALQYDPQPIQPPNSGLKGQWMSFQSTRHKMSLTSPESHPHSWTLPYPAGS